MYEHLQPWVRHAARQHVASKLVRSAEKHFLRLFWILKFLQRTFFHMLNAENKNVIIYINLVVDIFGVFPYFLWLHPSDYLWKSAFACRGALQKTQPKANRILKKKAWRKKDWENHGQNKEDSKMVKPPQVGLSEAVCWPLLIYKEKTYSASITFYFSLKLYWWF